MISMVPPSSDGTTGVCWGVFKLIVIIAITRIVPMKQVRKR